MDFLKIRLASILAKRTLNEKKLDEIKIKANILRSFATEKVDEAKDEAEEVKESAEKVAREEL